MQKAPEPHADVVHLRPILGVKPHIYLSVFYLLLVALLLFMVLFFPGIRAHGAILDVHTVPDSATVYIDDEYYGVTPFRGFVPSGERTIQVRKPYYRTIQFTEHVPGRLVASLLAPPRRRLTLSMEVDDLDALAKTSIQDFAANPHIPAILVETAKAINVCTDPAQRQILYEFLENALHLVTSEYQLRALLAATTMVAASGSIVSPSTIIETVRQIIHADKKHEYFHYWLLAALPKEAQEMLAATAWMLDRHAAYLANMRSFMPTVHTESSAAQQLFVNGVRFVRVPGGTYLMGKEIEPDDDGSWRIDSALAHPVVVQAHYAMETEVTRGYFQEFVRQNPMWAPDNRAALVAEGLATGEYLLDWSEAGPPSGTESLPVVYVSHHAALAFCEWIDSQLPAGYRGLRARLPLEAEWEWAARGAVESTLRERDELRGASAKVGAVFLKANAVGPQPVGASQPNAFGLRDMMGNVWEWCADWFSPVSYFLTDQASGTELTTGSEKIVRGGSWANSRELVAVSTRGSQPPSWCTPFLGFRVVLSSERLTSER